MTDEINEFFQKVGRMAVASVPSDDWTSIKLIERCISSYVEFNVSFFGTWGDEPKQTGMKDKHLQAGKRTHNTIKDLRQLMYNQDPQLGAWYTCVMTLSKNNDFDLKFDYENKPDWDHQPQDEAYAHDFKEFPRNAETIPEWLKPILIEFKEKYMLTL
jgi:hypothetical protein